MMPTKRHPVHVRGNQRIGVESLLKRNAANEGRNFAGNFIESAEHNVLAGRLYPCLLQHIVKSWTGKPCRAHCSLAPLNARHLTAMQAAAITGAFEGIYDSVRLNLGKFGEAKSNWLLHFFADGETPIVRVEFTGFVHVIAHEEVRHRRKPAIE